MVLWWRGVQQGLPEAQRGEGQLGEGAEEFGPEGLSLHSGRAQRRRRSGWPGKTVSRALMGKFWIYGGMSKYLMMMMMMMTLYSREDHLKLFSFLFP